MLKTSFILALFFLFGYSPIRHFLEEPAVALSPHDELKTFQLADGFDIELAAAEPLVEEPVVIKFDEKGRLWVIEMRAFMPDIEGSGEEDPIGRVSYLEDSNGDGQFDKKTVYADHLVLPRALQFYPDGVLIAENIPLWFYEDTNGDGVSDKRTLVDSTYGGGGLPEHSPNGLLLGKDNWLYNAKSKLRYKRVGDKWITEPTEFRGQWGIEKDDYGRLYYNYNWSQLHADLVPPNYLNRNPNYEATTGIDHGLTIERSVFPIHPTPAVNRGYIPGTLDKQGKLREFTSACAPYIHRVSGSWSADFYNNALICEPAGNLVKRNRVTENGNYLHATNVYDGFEFLASTDTRFRPVFITSGPDGAIYVADMYRGINQHGAYMTEYLREQTTSRGLDKTIHLGRIWRITPKDFKAAKTVDLSNLSADELVSNLSSPISFNRDESQRLLMQKQMKEAVPALEKLVKSRDMPTARINALWVLNNLNALSPNLCLETLGDNEPKVKASALALLEGMALANKQVQKNLEAAVRKELKKDLSPEMSMQLLLSSNALSTAFASELIQEIIGQYGSDALLRDAALSALHDREFSLIEYLLNAPNWEEKAEHKEIFLEQLAGIVIKRRNVEESNAFLKLLSSATDWQKDALLGGASMLAMTSEEPPLSIAAKPALFNTDSPAIQNLQKAFSWPGKKVTEVKTGVGLQLDAKGLKQFAAGRKAFLTYCAGCHGADGKGVNRFAPPLAGSEWVVGDAERLGLILLHGLEGPINVKGKLYDVPNIQPVMPAHATMADADIANILTYIRNEWGNSAEAVAPRTIGMLRVTSQGKVVPWTAPELNEHIETRKKKNN